MKKLSLMKRKTFVIYAEKKFSTDKNDKNTYHKVRDHYTEKFRGAAHNICNLRHEIPKKIPIVLHNCSTYDYNFIITQLAIKFKAGFGCLGDNSENWNIYEIYANVKHVMMNLI